MNDHILHSIHAAIFGDLATLRHLHDTLGVPWVSRVCLEAAANGHVACLQYAFENGCEIPHDAIARAVQFRRHACLRYMLSQYVLCTPSDMFRAVENNDLESVRILHEHGCTWPRDACDAATDVILLRYMATRGIGVRDVHKRRIAQHLLSKWRAGTKMRGISFYWQDCAARTSHAPGGAGWKRDREAFEREWMGVE